MNNNEPDIRWKQRFDNLQSALQLLREAVTVHAAKPEDDMIRMALIKSFEMTFELSWKTMKDYLKHNGIDVKLPREIIKQAFATDILVNGQAWIGMLEDRNLMTHVYDKALAQEAVNSICIRYMPEIEQLYRYLRERLT